MIWPNQILSVFQTVLEGLGIAESPMFSPQQLDVVAHTYVLALGGQRETTQLCPSAWKTEREASGVHDHLQPHRQSGDSFRYIKPSLRETTKAKVLATKPANPSSSPRIHVNVTERISSINLFPHTPPTTRLTHVHPIINFKKPEINKNNPCDFITCLCLPSPD